ncbi:MAG: alpha/beta hydrolase family protein [Solirubrobacteraceae bacterium]
MGRNRVIDPIRPARTGHHEGLAYTLWLPTGGPPPAAGVLVVHGAGSQKENHYDFARAALPLGLAVLTFDQRGHGETGGRLDARAVSDVVAMADLLREGLGAPAALALRGSSLGGYLAIRAAAEAGAQAVVAISPATAGDLRRALQQENLSFAADRPALETLLEAGGLAPVVAALPVPLLLMHAQGDERVPVQHSRELASAFHAPGSRLIEVPGGHHRSVQHDDDLQAASLRFVQKALGLR